MEIGSESKLLKQVIKPVGVVGKHSREHGMRGVADRPFHRPLRRQAAASQIGVSPLGDGIERRPGVVDRSMGQMQGTRDHGWHGLVSPDCLQGQLVPTSHQRRLGVGGDGLQCSAVQHRTLKSRPWNFRWHQGLRDLIQRLLHRGEWLGNVGDRDGLRSERR